MFGLSLISKWFLGRHGFTVFELIDKYEESRNVELLGVTCDGFSKSTFNKQGENPITYAAWRGLVDFIDLFLLNKIEPSSTNKRGQNAAHIFSMSGNSEGIKWALKNNISVTLKDSNSRSPVFYAIKLDRPKVFSLLMEHFAKNGLSPCLSQNEVEILKHLANWEYYRDSMR